jgi:predicted membrane-bound dolichyl-phosphate-mannose-protein mannosyltransferase
LGDHEIVYIDTNISVKLNKPVKMKIYIWKKANKDKLEDQASEMGKQFKEKFSLDRAINEIWDFIKSNILNILQESVPSKMSSTRFSLHWINRTVKQMSRQKNRNFDKARRTKKKSDIARYVNSKVPPKKNVEKHIKIMSRASSTQMYQATQKILELH